MEDHTDGRKSAYLARVVVFTCSLCLDFSAAGFGAGLVEVVEAALLDSAPLRRLNGMFMSTLCYRRAWKFTNDSIGR